MAPDAKAGTKRYSVIITRDTTESTTVDAEAEDKEGAAEKALEEATMHPERFDWVMNEGNPPTEPYLGDCAENDATEITE